MTDHEKEHIRRMRWQSSTYKEISKTLGIPEATIKTFCKRNQLQDTDLQILKVAREDFAIPVVCVHCGKLLDQGMNNKPKRFCSDKCRLAWWNSHRNEVNKKKIPRQVCPTCGKEFKSYDAGRKYCSHPCYIRARFRGDRYDS